MTHLWYSRPAADWEREALPIGNGSLGATVFGGAPSERIQLNEKTLWTGGPGSAEGYDHGDWTAPRPGALAAVRQRIDTAGEVTPEQVAGLLGQPRRGYGAYQRLGDIHLGLAHPRPDPGYRRELDLSTAMARVRYQAGQVTHQREFFASYPHQAIVGRLWAETPGAVTLTVSLAPAPAGANLTVTGGLLVAHGALADNGLRYETRVLVRAEGGRLVSGGDRVTVTGADAVTLIVVAGTDYAPVWPHYRGPDPAPRLAARLDAAAATPYEKLRAAHIADYRALADRVSLDIGQTDPGLPTDELLARYGAGGAADRWLEALHFAYGRYLLISSSRPGSLPANLQGVWNDSDTPAWSADYHPNINLQMCYWPAELTNLAETAAPLHDFIEALRTPGRVTARRMFDADGWVVHNETNPYGFTGVHDWPTAFWFPEAAAWLCRHLWEHYLFTLDGDFLRERAYPVMREAAELWLSTLHTDPRDGTLVASPSFSPEHGGFTAGAAMSQQIVWDLLVATVDAGDRLGEDTEALEAVLGRLDQGLRVGAWGQLREWKHDADDPTDTHRHVSHLYALHPGHQLAPPRRPDLAEAAAVSLRARGDGGPAWSRAWKMNLWARLGDGDRAHRLLTGLLRECTLPNLWAVHPPFQLDGNLGAVAGVAELLVQSHLGWIDALPALPAAWPDGSVTGLRARGGFTVDVWWRAGEATAVELAADHTGPVTVRCAALTGRPVVDLTDGAPVPVVESTFTAQAGHRYRWA